MPDKPDKPDKPDISINQKRFQIEILIRTIKDEEDRERWEAALEGYWSDEVSLDELIRDLREYHADERRWS